MNHDKTLKTDSCTSHADSAKFRTTRDDLLAVFGHDHEARSQLSANAKKVQASVMTQINQMPQQHVPQHIEDRTGANYAEYIGIKLRTWLRSLSRPTYAMPAFALLMGAAFIGVQLFSPKDVNKVEIASMKQEQHEVAYTEADLTFQELWLIEDAVLFQDTLVASAE